MKKTAISTIVALLMAMLFVVVVHGQTDSPGSMSIIPTEAPPGYTVSLNITIDLDVGSDHSTDMCLYIPMTNGNPVVEPPSSFEMENMDGESIIFSEVGPCFTMSDQLSVRYRATEVDTGPTTYRGGFSNTIVETAEPGIYSWSAVFFEAADSRQTSNISTQQAVLEPTAITLAGTGTDNNNGAATMPYVLGSAIFILSLAALFVLKRRFAIEA